MEKIDEGQAKECYEHMVHKRAEWVGVVQREEDSKVYTKRDCVRNAMNCMGWGGQVLPQSERWSELSTGCPAQDLQTALDWHKANHGDFDHWTRIFNDLREWSQNRIQMNDHFHSRGPKTYHSMCLFRVVGFESESVGVVDKIAEPRHFVGVCRGDEWLWRDEKGVLHKFDKPPVVDAWAYID